MADSPVYSEGLLRHVRSEYYTPILAQIFSSIVVRSIPSAAGTFTAFELTRGMALHLNLPLLN